MHRKVITLAGTIILVCAGLALMMAGRDEVIPTELGHRLHDGYDGPKKLIVQQGRTHNTLSYDPGEAWWWGA